jgi:lipopolysaccharide/colanic/teichoic acid biosynthesis glycosyltransferase
MSLVGRDLPQRDSDASRTGTASATSCCLGITGCGQVSGRADLDFDDLVRLDISTSRWGRRSWT